MSHNVIHTDSAPAAIGAYSQAVAAGNTVYISGQLGLIPQSGELAEGFAAQCQQMFRNLRAICEAAGGDLQKIVKLTIFVTDLSNFAELNKIMGEHIAAPYPARAAMQVSALPKGGLVEADAVMVL
ncbi:reactive intermediate/imine deaminase [Betaproteobacteria bacterium]|nr:reactive intermediate/imine deaminase [Betaproteobacteria bacterium]